MAIAVPEPYEQHRDYVLNVLARACGWLNDGDREEIYHDAYAFLLAKQRDGLLDVGAMNPHQVRSYLTKTAVNKARNEGNRAHRKTSVALEDGGLEVDDGQPEADAVLHHDIENARLREIISELPERQQVVIKLRHFFDRSPEEIQSYMGVNERVYRRELERGMRTLTEQFEQVRQGTFCESRRSLILGYVNGISGPKRMKKARQHLESCPGCRVWAAELRDTARQAGALVPMPLLGEFAHHGERLGGLGHHIEVVRERVGDLLGGARDHATALAMRADPTTSSALGAVRPGATVAAVASCLAIGSGATYCAVNGLPQPVRDLLGGSQQEAKAAPKRTSAQAPLPAPAATSTPSSKSPAKSTTSSSSAPKSRQQRRRIKAKQVEKQTAPEFGIEGSGTSQAGASSSQTAPSGAAPSDGNWGTEFGP